MKTCSKCGAPKEETEFYLREATGKRRGSCKECQHASRKSYRKRNQKEIADKDKVYRTKNRGEIAARHRRYKKENREKVATQQRFRKFGLSQGDWEKLKSDQKGVCAICKSDPKGKEFCVDHDHITGKVRALLCGKCNSAIGLLSDSSDLALRAAGYLKQHGK